MTNIILNDHVNELTKSVASNIDNNIVFANEPANDITKSTDANNKIIISNNSNNELTKHLFNIFKYNTVNIRFIYISDNDWYVGGKDIADILKYADQNKALKHVQTHNKKSLSQLKSFLSSAIVAEEPLNVPGNFIFINEAGLYELIQKSKKSEAQYFRNWINEKVLPSIRKTGSYNSISNNIDKNSNVNSNNIDNNNSVLSVIQNTFKENNQLKNDNMKLKEQLERKLMEIEIMTRDYKSEIEILQKKNLILKNKYNYHKFQKGPCVYILSNNEPNTYKIGKVNINNKKNDINLRLCRHRTTNSRLKLEYLIFLEKSSFLEQAIFTRYEKNKELEHIKNIPLKDIIEHIKTCIKIFCLDATEADVTPYNNDVDTRNELFDYKEEGKNKDQEQIEGDEENEEEQENNEEEIDGNYEEEIDGNFEDEETNEEENDEENPTNNEEEEIDEEQSENDEEKESNIEEIDEKDFNIFPEDLKLCNSCLKTKHKFLFWKDTSDSCRQCCNIKAHRNMKKFEKQLDCIKKRIKIHIERKRNLSGSKLCNNCNTIKPLYEFYTANKNKPLGRTCYYCIPCSNKLRNERGRRKKN